MRALVLAAVVVLAGCSSQSRRASVVGPTAWHACSERTGRAGERVYECPEYAACSAHGCEWLGDPEGPGWGDIQQEGGPYWPADR